MKNSCVVSSNNKGVYLSIRPEPTFIKKIFLLASNIAVTGFIFIVLFYLNAREIGLALIPLMVALLFSSVLLMRYTLWNFVGKEVLVVNRRSITTQRDYGLFIMKPLTIPCHEWMVTYEKTAMTARGVLGKIVVQNYLKNSLAKRIYETTTQLRREDGENFIHELQQMIDSENRRFPVVMEKLQFPRLMDN